MNELQRVIDEHGPWTAMAIKLKDGSYTRERAADYRLRRLLQVSVDLVGKPLAECRVLDLACLEGHYAIEFALHGAEVLGIEGRAASVAKCEYVRNNLGLNRARFVQDDVRNLSPEKYGVFDIVICSGLLYHLPAKDARALLESMHRCCTGIVLVDTFVALASQRTIEVGGAERHGLIYPEHDAAETEDKRLKKLWASLDNEASFWFTEPSLMNMLQEIGFTSLLDVLGPAMPGNLKDRKTYAAIKGRPAVVLSSDPTRDASHAAIDEGDNPRMDAVQTPRGPLFLAAKRLLPQSVKDIVKPALRAMRLLPADTTPEFQRKR